MEPYEIAAALRRTTVFAGLDDDILGKLGRYMRPVRLAHGEWLFQQGDLGDGCYILAEGLVRLVVARDSAEETSLALLGPGGFFGELSLFEPEGRRHAGALAEDTSLLLAIPPAAFDEILRQQPSVALNLLRRVAANQRRSDERAISDLREKNAQLTAAYTALESAQAEALRRARVARELELARDLQRSLLPQSMPSHPALRCSAASFPAFEMSGDFYDLQLVDGAVLTIVMADVCDKGAQAAMVMALTKGLLLATPDDERTPLLAVQRANQLLCGTGIAGAVVTLVYAALDLEHNTLRYARAGHEWPLLYQRRTQTVIALEASGMPLGIDSDALLEESQVAIEPGDSLVLYTDGMTEAHSPADEEYGRDRFSAAVRAYGHLHADEMAEALIADVRAWQGNTLPTDDLTLLVVQRV